MSRSTITQSKFNAVKIMLNAGTPTKEIMEYLEVTDKVVTRCRKCETYEEYREMASANAYMMKKRAEEKAAAEKAAAEEQKKQEQPQQIVQVVEHRQSVQIQATEYMMRELKQTNEYLRIISNKMAAIIDDLYGTGVKK